MRARYRRTLFSAALLTVSAALAGPAATRDVEVMWAVPSSAAGHDTADPEFRAKLRSSAEVPSYVGSGHGRFTARLDGEALDFMLAYTLEGDVQQAHIHVGQAFTNGGVVAFLCSNLDSAPPGVQPCSGTTEGMVAGTLTGSDVRPTQGAASFDDLVEALASGIAYINVHSTDSPSGEIRGQVRDLRYRDRGDGDDDDDDYDDSGHGDDDDDDYSGDGDDDDDDDDYGG